MLVGADYDDCSNTCITTPKFKYQKYVYNGASLTKGGTYNSSTDYKLTVECSEVATKTIPVYANVTVYDVVSREEPAYAYVKYYSTRTCTVEKKQVTTVKWSDSSNDQNLINQGYTKTGKKKEK